MGGWKKKATQTRLGGQLCSGPDHGGEAWFSLASPSGSNFGVADKNKLSRISFIALHAGKNVEN